MINIKNAQKLVKVDTRQLKKTAHQILVALGCDDWDVGIKITDNKGIMKLNKTYRGKDGPTDVLSFANIQWESPQDCSPQHRLQPPEEDMKDLGDMIISAEYMTQYCKEHGLDAASHWSRILVHGCVHLVGYDHETDEQFALMSAKEQQIMQQLK